MRIKTVMLGAAMVAALCVGLWLFILPSLDRKTDLEQQGELLDSILTVMPDEYAVADYDAEIPAFDCESSVAEYAELNAGSLEDEAYEPLEAYEPEEPASATPCFEPLNLDDFPSGITPIGILTIDSIELCLPVMEGVDEREMRIAPGRVPQTASVGEIGNAVIAGHRNYDFGSMFNRLGEVEIGDEIGFQAMNGEKMLFEVFEILVVDPDNQIAFIQPKKETIITLYTCTPVRVATHRLLIRARIIEGGI